MNDAAWWARVVEGRTPSFTAYRPKRIRVLRKEGREAAIDGNTVLGIGAEICSRWTGGAAQAAPVAQQAELVGSIADTRTMFEGEAVGVNAGHQFVLE